MQRNKTSGNPSSFNKIDEKLAKGDYMIYPMLYMGIVLVIASFFINMVYDTSTPLIASLSLKQLMLRIGIALVVCSWFPRLMGVLLLIVGPISAFSVSLSPSAWQGKIIGSAFITGLIISAAGVLLFMLAYYYERVNYRKAMEAHSKIGERLAKEDENREQANRMDSKFMFRFLVIAFILWLWWMFG